MASVNQVSLPVFVSNGKVQSPDSCTPAYYKEFRKIDDISSIRFINCENEYGEITGMKKQLIFKDGSTLEIDENADIYSAEQILGKQLDLKV